MTENNSQSNSQKLKKTSYTLALIFILIVILVAGYKLYSTVSEPSVVEPVHIKVPQPMVEPKVESIPQPEIIENEPQVIVTPVIPVEDPALKYALPELNGSDPVIIETLTEFFQKQTIKLLIQEDFIRRLVVYTDNIAKGNVATKHSPFIKPNEDYSVIEGDILTPTAESYERYTPYVALFTNMTSQQIFKLYQQYKPLFDEAYQEIGYEEGEFDNTIRDAIDMLLTTPTVTGNVPLIGQSVTYKYAYSQWEELPKAQKQFLRMGAKNVKKVKSALKGIKPYFESDEQ